MTEPTTDTAPAPLSDRQMLERLVEAVTRGDYVLPKVYREAREHLEAVPATVQGDPIVIPGPVEVRHIQPGSDDDQLADAFAWRLHANGLGEMPTLMRKTLAEKLIPDVREVQALDLENIAKGFRADAAGLGSSWTAAAYNHAADVCEARAAEHRGTPTP